MSACIKSIVCHSLDSLILPQRTGLPGIEARMEFVMHCSGSAQASSLLHHCRVPPQQHAPLLRAARLSMQCMHMICQAAGRGRHCSGSGRDHRRPAAPAGRVCSRADRRPGPRAPACRRTDGPARRAARRGPCTGGGCIVSQHTMFRHLTALHFSLQVAIEYVERSQLWRVHCLEPGMQPGFVGRHCRQRPCQGQRGAGSSCKWFLRTSSRCRTG